LLASLKEPRWPGSLKAALQWWPELAQLAHIAPRAVIDAAFNDRLIKGNEIDLASLQIQRSWSQDVGRLVTLGLVIPRGPQKSRQNIKSLVLAQRRRR